ncbi:MAG: glycosyltransferase family 1 protein [Bacteroidetes bacterium]|nr:glycosyltransferase family 1 protein [Bacteroidota bacterium]
MKKPRLLLLYCSDKFDSYAVDWFDAFNEADYLDCVSYDLYDLSNSLPAVKRNIKEVDFIVALHSTNTNPSNIRTLMAYVPALKKRKVPFISFIGNEYNIPFNGCRLSEKIDLFKVLKAEVICTQLKLESAQLLYKELKDTKIVEYPHALNEKVFIAMKKPEERKLDLGIKTTRYGSYLGDNERNAILDFFKDNSEKYGLTASIENNDNSKVGRQGWVDFLNDCKGTIGNESGTNYTEADDHTVIEIMQYAAKKLHLKKQPWWFSKFEDMLYHYKPYVNYNALLKLYHVFNTKLYLIRLSQFNIYAPIASYNPDEIFDVFFRKYKNPISTRCISSRHFDAIGTKTCQILFNGDYNYILKPDQHYLMLNKDFSNINEVVQKFRDDSFRNNLTENAHSFVLQNHTYKARIKDFYDNVILPRYKLN